MSAETIRRDQIYEEIEGTAIETNGFEIPAEPGRYLVIETGSGERIWAYSCETLDECAQDINDSDTTRDDVLILDLDTDTQLVPILAVVRVYDADGAKVWEGAEEPVAVRDFEAEYSRINRIGRYLREEGPVPMATLELLDMAQQIIRIESRMAGREVH